jgi:hypothetical protein
MIEAPHGRLRLQNRDVAFVDDPKRGAESNGAVNKRNLSTGETRESAREFLAPQAQPGG